MRKRRARAWMALLPLLIIALLAAPALPAEEGVEIHERFSPDRLGASTNLSLAARLSSASASVRQPVHKFTVYAPAGLRIDADGASVCAQTALEQRGPSACPADSRAGFGGGVGVLQLRGETVKESYTLDFFFASVRPGHVSLLIYASAVKPVNVELILIAHEVHAAAPYGLGFTVEVPPISVIPGAESASIETAFATLGDAHAAYYRRIHGRRQLVHVPGLIVPRSCPAGGFPTRAIIQFASGYTLTLNPMLPCPK